jgi:TRAP-type C4-dicarboxylate transport system permease small subunit
MAATNKWNAKRVWDNLEEYICIFLILAMLVILTMQVVLRFCFNTGLDWSEELARFGFIWMVFIATSMTAKSDSHIKIDFFNEIWPKKLRKYINKVGIVFGIVFSVLLMYFGYRHSLGVFRQGQFAPGTNVKLGFIYIAIPIGYTLTLVRLCVRLFSAAKDRFENNKDREDLT